MHNNKTLALSLLTTLLVITGCTQTQTVSNTNDSTTTNSPVNENSNTVVTNTNTIESDVDTSAWLTYTNEDYGFSFRYPEEWGKTVVTTREPDEYHTGSITQIIFDNDRSRNGNVITAVIKIETLDYEFFGPTDGDNISFSQVDLTQTEDQLQEVLKLNSTVDNVVTKITTANNMNGLVVDETIKSLGGEEQYYIEYLFPRFHAIQTLNMRIFGKKEIKQTLELLVSSLVNNS